MKLLSLTGGGFRGFYSANVIANLELHFNTLIHEKCDCIAGTSIGGIIALGLASGKSAQEIIAAFIKHKNEIFKPKSWYHSFYYSNRYSNVGLVAAIKDILGEHVSLTLAQLSEINGTDIILTTVEMNTGRTLLLNSLEPQYKGWTVLDAALATSAAPTYFPAHTRRNIRYLDGGVSCNMPDLAAAQLYSDFRAIDIQKISLLSIGTCYTAPNQLGYGEINNNAGAITWAANLEYFLDLQAPLIERQCKAVFQQHMYTRIDAQLTKRIKLDDTSDETIKFLLKKAKISTSNSNILNNTPLIQFLK